MVDPLCLCVGVSQTDSLLLVTGFLSPGELPTLVGVVKDSNSSLYVEHLKQDGSVGIVLSTKSWVGRKLPWIDLSA